MSSPRESGSGAPAATKKQRDSSQRKLNPPWREILEQMKSPSISLYRVYQRAGISKSRRYWMSRTPDLRLSEAYRLALAAGVDPGRFMEAVALAMGPLPLYPLPEDGRDRSRDAVPPKPKKVYRCGLCNKPGHTRKACPSANSSAVLLLRARGAAKAANDQAQEDS